jgi:hypothetical protein
MQHDDSMWNADVLPAASIDSQCTSCHREDEVALYDMQLQ